MRLPTKHDFRVASGAAVQDERLRDAVRTVTGLLLTNRSRAVADDPGFEELRSWGRERKLAVSANLEQAAGRFAAKVESLGGQVHRARDAQDVGRIVGEIARNRQLRTAVKSKSMTAEEVGLNEFLAAAGIAVTETDLGEFIIQLADEKPSHILAPAIHRSKAEISQLFAEKIGAPAGLDAQGLVHHARAFLRQRFLQAEMGITGANFAVAETGTLVLVTNEGNGRMCTSLPPVHVALVGIDKVIPKIADLPGFLRLLTRSASGQTISSYVSLTTGPRRPGDGEGPEELHVILLDNGRAAIAAGPCREMLHCLHCSSCLNHCPVYCAVGGHAWESPYPGPMGSILSSLLWGRRAYPDLAHACTLCGRCAEVCPVKIPLPDYHLRLRGIPPGKTRKSRTLSAAAAKAMTLPLLYRAGLAAARRRLRSNSASRIVGALSPAARAWQSCRALPRPEAGPTFRHWWKAREGRKAVERELVPTGAAPGRNPDGPPSTAAVPEPIPVALMERYLARAAAAGTEVSLVSRRDLAARLDALLNTAAVVSAALPSAGWPKGWREELLATLEGRACRVVAPGPAAAHGDWDRSALAGASLGVIFCPTVLADTGSLVLASGAGMGTLASLLPDTTLVLSEPAHLLESFGAYLEGRSEPLAARTTLVSGPSRTGDIPGSMTLGVHGPRKVMHWIIGQ
jgi:L-lactate dehydrogenase complex protein LldF